MTPEASSPGQSDTGNPVMDSDHRALVELLESFACGCKDRGAADRACVQCTDVTVGSCQAMLNTAIGRVQRLLLDHFQREDELMTSLPRTLSARNHCIRHRREHVRFSTRYNNAVASLDSRQPGVSSNQFEALVSEWIRKHTFEYDLELAALLATGDPA